MNDGSSKILYKCAPNIRISLLQGHRYDGRHLVLVQISKQRNIRSPQYVPDGLRVLLRQEFLLIHSHPSHDGVMHIARNGQIHVLRHKRICQQSRFSCRQQRAPVIFPLTAGNADNRPLTIRIDDVPWQTPFVIGWRNTYPIILHPRNMNRVSRYPFCALAINGNNDIRAVNGPYGRMRHDTGLVSGHNQFCPQIHAIPPVLHMIPNEDEFHDGQIRMLISVRNHAASNIAQPIATYHMKGRRLRLIARNAAV